MASLQDAFLPNTATIPPRALNGGLYTGEPFLKNAPWGNVPVIPDTTYMINLNLMSADPPSDALYQYPGGNRLGNNYTKMTGVEQSPSIYNLQVVNGPKVQPHEVKDFSKYSYL
jgi:hypothetical protein